MDTYVVVAEVGLAGNNYGATISVSEPGSQVQARAYLEEVLDGKHPQFFELPDQAQVIRVGSETTLVIQPRRIQPDRLTRLSIGRLG